MHGLQRARVSGQIVGTTCTLPSAAAKQLQQALGNDVRISARLSERSAGATPSTPGLDWSHECHLHNL